MSKRKRHIIILMVSAALLLLSLWRIFGWRINEKIWETFMLATAVILLLALLAIFIWWGYRPKWRRRTRIIIVEEILRLVRKETELSQGLEIMAQDAPWGTRRKCLDLAREISQGKSLAAGFASQRLFFGDFAVNLIRAGESSGRVGEMLSLLVKTWQDEEKNRQETRDAISYPIYLCLLVPVMTMIILYIFLFILPRFGEISTDYAYSFGGVPLLTENIYFKSSLVFRNIWFALTILVIVVFGIARLGRGLSRLGAGSKKNKVAALLLLAIPYILSLTLLGFMDFGKSGHPNFALMGAGATLSLFLGISLLLGYLWDGFWSRAGVARYRLPILGTLLKEKALARFCRIWAALLGGVKTLPEALKLTADALGKGPYRRLALGLAKEMERGGSLGDSLTTSPLVTRTAYWMVSFGEKEGRLSHSLERTARFYEIKAEYRARLLRRILGPLGIIAAGCCVASLFLLVISTLASIVGAFA